MKAVFKCGGGGVNRLWAPGVGCLAYLSSPGTAFPIPEDAYKAAGRQHDADKNKWWHAPLSLVTGGFRPNCRPPTNRSEGSSPCFVHNGHLILQGPNYALAKTLQNWRTVAARAGEGGVKGVSVSANMAPGKGRLSAVALFTHHVRCLLLD